MYAYLYPPTDAEFNSLSLLCEASIEGCPNEYYLLRNETHFAIVVVRELGGKSYGCVILSTVYL